MSVVGVLLRGRRGEERRGEESSGELLPPSAQRGPDDHMPRYCLKTIDTVGEQLQSMSLYKKKEDLKTAEPCISGVEDDAQRHKMDGFTQKAGTGCFAMSCIGDSDIKFTIKLMTLLERLQAPTRMESGKIYVFSSLVHVDTLEKNQNSTRQVHAPKSKAPPPRSPGSARGPRDGRAAPPRGRGRGFLDRLNVLVQVGGGDDGTWWPRESPTPKRGGWGSAWDTSAFHTKPSGACAFGGKVLAKSHAVLGSADGETHNSSQSPQRHKPKHRALLCVSSRSSARLSEKSPGERTENAVFRTETTRKLEDYRLKRPALEY
eukprot:scaffold1747_cov251-Pinguiococcus_pyrenoidosus.AAC.1